MFRAKFESINVNSILLNRYWEKTRRCQRYILLFHIYKLCSKYFFIRWFGICIWKNSIVLFLHTESIWEFVKFFYYFSGSTIVKLIILTNPNTTTFYTKNVNVKCKIGNSWTQTNKHIYNGITNNFVKLRNYVKLIKLEKFKSMLLWRWKMTTWG